VRHSHRHKVKLLAEIVFNEAFEREDRFPGFSSGEQATVILRENLLNFAVVANAGPPGSAILPVVMECTSA
jgi:hypothetical protein